MANDSALEQRIQIQLGSNKAIIIVKTILGDYYKKKKKIYILTCGEYETLCHFDGEHRYDSASSIGESSNDVQSVL